MRHTERELAQVLHTGPFHLALRTALSVRGLPLHRVQHHLAHRGVKLGVTSLSYWQQGVAAGPAAPSRCGPSALWRTCSRCRTTRCCGYCGATVPVATGSARRHARTARCWSPRGRWNGCWRRWSHRWTAGCTPWTTRNGYGSGRGASWRAAPRSMSYGRTGTGSTAIWRSTAAIRGATTSRISVRAGENCRTGRVRWDGEAGVLVAELLFDTRLRSGETYLFGYGFEDGTGGASGEYVRGFTFGGGQYVLQVGFDEAALPVRCRRFEQASAGAARGARRDLTLTGRHRTVHVVEEGVRPGLVGIDWDWD
ncbi:XRE family transcriptional regulator OS=Streptomyces microflavus OX=1919 GN=Smic_16660 PE=4 SV=1 [Streptomyces microflavus]